MTHATSAASASEVGEVELHFPAATETEDEEVELHLERLRNVYLPLELHFWKSTSLKRGALVLVGALET
jgi:hypothetical protein